MRANEIPERIEETSSYLIEDRLLYRRATGILLDDLPKKRKRQHTTQEKTVSSIVYVYLTVYRYKSSSIMCSSGKMVRPLIRGVIIYPAARSLISLLS